MEYTFKGAGKYTLKCCSSGKEALQNLDSFSPDLVLLDIMMPEMDGMETLKKIREIPKFKDLPVIFMTAKVQKKEVEHYRTLGILDVIPKPFDPITLPQKVETLWEKHSKK